MAIAIIIATHGKLAEGIVDSAQMIFGKQEDLFYFSLTPEKSPENFANEIIQTMQQNNQNQFLCLTDFVGGTPYNQLNLIFNKNKEKIAIITGINLPMLVEAFADRINPDATLNDIVKELTIKSKQSIQTIPEIFNIKEKDYKTKIITPEISDPNARIKIVLARIDSRLLHGQVATSWSRDSKPDRIIVVSDSVAKDQLRKELMKKAAPPGIKTHTITINKMIEISQDPRFGNTKALLLFENPQDALKVIEGGVNIKELNIGSMSHSTGKVMINNVLSMNHEDVETFQKLKDKNIQFDVRKVPNDNKQNLFDLINKNFHNLKNK